MTISATEVPVKRRCDTWPWRFTERKTYVRTTFHGTKRGAEREWQRRWAEIEKAGASFAKPDRERLGDCFKT